MQIPIIALVGPTAVGKTDLSIKIAQELNAEIISADSMQIYNELNIGTAKISPAEMKNIKHHLINVCSIKEDFSVADFQDEAYKAITDIHARGKIPFLVGGTGLYVNSVLYDYHFFPEPDNLSQLRERIKNISEKKRGKKWLIYYVSKKNKKILDSFHPNNTQRLIRAVEKTVLLKEIKPPPEKPFALKPLIFGLTRNRAELYSRINKRVEEMLEKGWYNELESLLNNGYLADLRALQSLGYRELISYSKAETDWQETVELIKRNTRRYAKRQITWFTKDEKIQWFNLSEKPQNEIFKIILAYSKSFLYN